MQKPEILPSASSLFKATADKLVNLYEASIKEKGTFTIALSGGNTPKKLYELLAKPPYAKKINWKAVFVFWSDERYVPFSDENNNSRMAHQALLGNVDIPGENIFRVPVNLTPAKAAAQYEQMIKRFFKENQPRFDLVLLGLGEDGHTASLFPGSQILEEKKLLVKQVHLAEKNVYRISFTVPLINNARHILFLVSGKEKSSILAKLLNKPVKKNQFPAGLINAARGKLYWYIDKAAASQLKF